MREGVFEPGQQVWRETDPSRAGDVVAEQEPVRGDSLVDEFAEVTEQAFLRGFAEVIGGQDNDTIASQVESRMGQRDGFGETGRPGPGEHFTSPALS